MSQSTTAIYDLLRSDFEDRMLHPIPKAGSVVRHKWIVERCKGQCVLDVGGSGPLHDLIVSVSQKCVSVDKAGADLCVDLDKSPVPMVDGITLVVCGEVVEHLSNPGFFLDGLRRYPVPVIFTVPNAFTDIGTKWVKRGIENVNDDHVAYYSHHTFHRLLSRHGFCVETFCWYNGAPGTAEGLIFQARAN